MFAERAITYYFAVSKNWNFHFIFTVILMYDTFQLNHHPCMCFCTYGWCLRFNTVYLSDFLSAFLSND